MGHSVLCLLILVSVDLLSARLILIPENCPLDPCHLKCNRIQICRRDLKCCIVGCERKCVRLNERCLSPCDDLCVGDHQCRPGAEKCCYKNCRKQCVSVIQDVFNPGSCPNPSSLRCDLCSSDGDCSDGGRCCSDGCKKTCIRGFSHSPGVSLVRPRCFFAARRMCDECFNDGDCKGCKKCCRNACGYRVCVSIGNCPPPPPPLTECLTDNDCYGFCNKCRSVGNERKCVQTQQVSNCGTVDPSCSLCGRNRWCPMGKTCCDVGCGLQMCVATVDGRCPATNNRDCCCSDFDCRRGQKCCIDGCGRRCINPLDVPILWSCPKNTLPSWCVRCSTNSDCLEGQTCSDHGCGFRICQFSVSFTDFYRRLPIPENNKCCRSDGECRSGYKCCEKGCRRVCVKMNGPSLMY